MSILRTQYSRLEQPRLEPLSQNSELFPRVENIQEQRGDFRTRQVIYPFSRTRPLHLHVIPSVLSPQGDIQAVFQSTAEETETSSNTILMNYSIGLEGAHGCRLDIGSLNEVQESSSVVDVKAVLGRLERAIKENRGDIEGVTSLLQEFLSWGYWDHENVVLLGRKHLLAVLRSLSSFLFGYNGRSSQTIEASQFRVVKLFYKKVVEAFKNDRDVVRSVVSNYGVALQYASDECKSDKGVALKAFMNDCSAIQYIAAPVLQDKAFIMHAIAIAVKRLTESLVSNDGVSKALNDYQLLSNISDEYFPNDTEIALYALLRLAELLHVDYSCRDDYPITIYLIEESFFAPLVKSFEKDKEALLKIVGKYGLAIRYVNPSFSEDEELCLNAIHNEAAALTYISEWLQLSREFMLKAVMLNEDVLYYSEYFADDIEFLREAVEKNLLAIKHTLLNFKDRSKLLKSAQAILRSE